MKKVFITTELCEYDTEMAIDKIKEWIIEQIPDGERRTIIIEILEIYPSY